MKPATKQLLEENNRRAEDLSPETQQVFTNLVCYLRGTSVPMEQQEQVRQDILNMLLEGEARGQSAREIIGEDDQAFCDAILAELPRRSTEQQTIYLGTAAGRSASHCPLLWAGGIHLPHLLCGGGPSPQISHRRPLSQHGGGAPADLSAGSDRVLPPCRGCRRPDCGPVPDL